MFQGDVFKGDVYLKKKKKLHSHARADKLPGLGLVKCSSVSLTRNVAVETCWVLFSRAKVASFQLALLSYSVESIALA